MKGGSKTPVPQTLLQKSNPMTYQLLLDAISKDINKQKEDTNDVWARINSKIVGAEIIYSTPTSFYIVNNQQHKRYCVSVGEWQIREF